MDCSDVEYLGVYMCLQDLKVKFRNSNETSKKGKKWRLIKCSCGATAWEMPKMATNITDCCC